MQLVGRERRCCQRFEFAVFGTAYFLTEIPVMLAATVVYRRAWALAPAGINPGGPQTGSAIQ